MANTWTIFSRWLGALRWGAVLRFSPLLWCVLFTAPALSAPFTKTFAGTVQSVAHAVARHEIYVSAGNAIAVLDDSAARHGASGLVIINFSGLALGGTVGTQAVTLRPGLNPSLTIGRSAKITLHTRLKERSYQSYAHTLALSGAERALLILFPPFYKGSVEVQARVLIDAPPVARE
mgnify:CR=1 FL=1